MRTIGIFYATREGQTRKIVRHVADHLMQKGLDVELWNVKNRAPAPQFFNYDAVILAASVHGGKHEREMVKFVKEHRDELRRKPTAFLSVSLSEAGVELPESTSTQRALSSAAVQEMLNRFFHETEWHPDRVRAVAGALRYTRYNFLTRFVMKYIAKESGGSTDTTRDHEYTDWPNLDRFIDGLAVKPVPAKMECCAVPR
jgi:menaquinone-dependent protoporphyrinogen oxidase